MRQVAFALVIAAGAVVAWHPARVVVQTLLLLPALFPTAPFDPLSRFAAAPTVEQHSATYTAGSIDTQLFIPTSSGHHPAIILLLGAGDLPRSDVAVHFADDLARLGILVSVPEPSGMFAEHLSFDEVDAIRVSVDDVLGRSDVDPDHVGLVGLSASGGLSIVAAGQPDLRDRIRFVNSFGSYADALSLLVDVASNTMSLDGVVRDWQPEQRTLDVASNALIEAGVSDADREELLSTPSRERAAEIVAGFSPQVQEHFAQLSPTTYLRQIHAHIYLMHDLDDPFIPFTQSRELVANAPPGLVTRFTEFSIFAHVIPERPVPWQTFVPDLWRLFWHVHAVLLELL
jgi:hypothetical protein